MAKSLSLLHPSLLTTHVIAILAPNCFTSAWALSHDSFRNSSSNTPQSGSPSVSSRLQGFNGFT
jgi:hypothetical protein